MRNNARPASLPAAIHIGYMGRIDRSDAIARVQGLIRRQVIAPEASYWQVQRMEDGFAYEIHEGGPGRGYLSALVSRFAAEPEAIVHLRAGDRTIRVTAPEGKPRSVVLPESERPTIDAVPPGKRMRPFAPTGRAGLITACIFFATAAVLFMATSVALNTSAQTKAGDSAALNQRVENLPHFKWPKAPTRPGEYVDKVQFSNGKWVVDEKPVPLPPRSAPDAMPDTRIAPSGAVPRSAVPAAPHPVKAAPRP